MTSKSDAKALVTVLEDIESANTVVEALREQGYATDKIELVTHNVHQQAPEIEPEEHAESTSDSLIHDAGKGAGLGVIVGIAASVFAPVPGLGLAMILTGGVIGGAFGGIAGLQHAAEDNSVDLPSIEEYQKLVEDGHFLVVVNGTHDEVAKAASIIEDLPYIHNHVHRLHGHDAHEHGTHKS